MPNLKLDIQGLTKKYSAKEGVGNINLQVNEGELLTLLGPSGCGKTTILRSIGGFNKIDSGKLILDGQEIQTLPPEKRPTGMVFQSYNLWPHMTVYENMAFGPKLRKTPSAQIKQQIADMLALVKMSGCEKKYPTQLSGGQQQRIAIARALMLKPSLLLLDEPFSALDAKIRAQMRVELKNIQEEAGLTIIFVTHDQEEAMAISDRIAVMNQGCIEQLGSPTEIYNNPASRFVAEFIGEMNFVEDTNGTLAVRPEDVVLKPASGEGMARIQNVMPLGHYTQIVLSCRNGAALKAFVPKEQALYFTENQAVDYIFNHFRHFDVLAHTA
ncbi:ABC transporter ATP-binding protein [Scatolibacter rhodanostii]|uniref:ABC transporter ATP-binding protein n=1 Tax=Scatolibacter rhodanostii TaxID=2014781 RepID=UPI000C07C064|nr:ABC transporter ATP-binding protein [Scatolibacter rhodanostii]